MSSDFPPQLRSELLDDFYAECDELLTSSRAALVALENNLDRPAVVHAQVEALFRHVHSFKGNSAIVGLRIAEELAHRMEDLLRGVVKGKTALTAPMVDGLLRGLQRLEQIVTAQRLAKPQPPIADLLAELDRLGGMATVAPPVVADKTPPAEAPSETTSPEVAARARGLGLWRCVFSPTPALDKRGINVASVRGRLTALGEIVRATPSVKGKTIVFEFILGVAGAAPDFAGWAEDEIVVTPLPTETGPAVTTPVPAAAEALNAPASPSASSGLDELSLTPSHLVRVDLARLDDLMRILGELVVQRSRLEDRLGQVRGETSGLKEVNLAMARSLREMREAISRVRLVPIAEIFSRMPFVVRELARESEKKARVVLEGHQTVVDKFLVERLKEPLLHLVRNAFAHGIETPAQRTAAGKPAEATITLRATSLGDSVMLQIRDDGRGIDAAKVAARAKSLGLAVPDKLDGEGLLRVLCLPGFSTRDQADLAAGRGVGMAVVATTLRELGGRLTLDSSPGSGTEFTLRLPLTLSILDVLIAEVGGQLCAVPQNAVAEIIQLETDVTRTIQQTEVIPYRDGLLPVVRLRSLFRFPAAAAGGLTVMVLLGEHGTTGLVVDRVRMQREVVVRPLVDPLLRVPGIAAATELGDGRPILILDPTVITSGVFRPKDRDSTSSDFSAAERRAS